MGYPLHIKLTMKQKLFRPALHRIKRYIFYLGQTELITFNLGQNSLDKFTKVSKIGFLWNVLRDFSGFSSTTVKKCRMGGRLDTCYQFQAFKVLS